METINRAYKTKLDPTLNQIRQFRDCNRVANAVFNWILADYMAEYKIYHTQVQLAKKADLWIDGKKSKEAWIELLERCSAAGIVIPEKPRPNGRVVRKKKLNAVKREDPKLNFMFKGTGTYPYAVLQAAADDFDDAMKNYQRHRDNGDVSRKIQERKDNVHHKRRIARMIADGRVGQQLDPYFPRFKSRSDPAAFRFSAAGMFTVETGRIKIPKIGWVRLAESGYIPVNPIKFCSLAIREEIDSWYVSVTVEDAPSTPPQLTEHTLGVSVGIADLLATSEGMVINNPHVWDQYAQKKKRLQRELSRRSHRDKDDKVIRGKNFRKSKKKIARLDRKIANTRSWHLHNASRAVADTLAAEVVIKEMDIQKLLGDAPRDLARRMADAGMGELTRQVIYKNQWQGTKVSKGSDVIFCSQCSSYDITYADQMMRCRACGHTMRHSVNIAINLKKHSEHQNAD